MKPKFYNTIRTQVEILPRLTIIYGEGYHKGFAIEWLWFGVFVKVRQYPKNKQRKSIGKLTV